MFIKSVNRVNISYFYFKDLNTYICVFKFTVSDNHGLLPTLPDSVNLSIKKRKIK